MIDAVSSMVMTGRWMNGRDRPEENWTSFFTGVLSLCCPGASLWKAGVGAVGGLILPAVIVRSHRR